MSELVRAQQGAPIFLCGEPTNMRLGLPGLAKKVEAETKKDPKKSKGIYIFISKNFERVKIFYWDRNGYAVWYKHCPKGIFRIEQKGGYKAVTGVDVKALLGGKGALVITEDKRKR